MTMRNSGGGDDLFRSIFNRHYARMLRYFRRAFHVSDEDAQELTQESFMRFYRTMHEYRGEAEWALLEIIAKNVGLNRVRSLTTIKRGAVKPESLDDWDHPRGPKAEQADPVDRMIQEERIRRMWQSIAGLPSGQRRCVQLRLEGLSYEEIATTLRISVDAVKSRLRDAKRLLRERLGDESELPEE